MRLYLTLPCLLALGSTVLGAAAPSPLARKPDAESKAAPAAVARASGKSTGARGARGTTPVAARESDAPKTAAQLVKEREGWLAALQSLHSMYDRQIHSGAAGLERIEKDPAFAALPSERNRELAAIPAAEALRMPPIPQASDYVAPLASRPAPMGVEQVMRQGEMAAFRTGTSTAETQGLVSRIRRVPGVAAGGHLSVDGMSSALLTPQLRTVPGSRRAPRAYAVANMDVLRAAMVRGKANLDGEYEHVRDCWALLSAQSDELQRKYAKLRDALVARDE